MNKILYLLLIIGSFITSCKKDDTAEKPAPSVVSISPVRGRVGTVVTINGEFFSRLRKENSVTFNGVNAKIITFNEEHIYVEVPDSGTTGPVTVTVAGKVVEGPSFEYMEPITPYMAATFAGDGTAAFADGTGTAARFNNPEGVAVDSKGNVIVADRVGNRIRKISPDGVVTTLAGTGTAGKVNGPAATATFNGPWKVAVDKNDNIIVADRTNNLIRKISADGIVSTIAGSGVRGKADGQGTAASFDYPQDVDIDENGIIYVVDYTNDRIRKITQDGTVSTLAGSTTGYADGTGTLALFNKPSGLVIDKEGNLLVADRNNNRIRKITPDGVVTTLAGNDTKGVVDGDLSTGSFSEPYGICTDKEGNIYVADLAGHAIRKITIYDEVITISGNKGAGFADGDQTTAKFNSPTDVAVDEDGNVFVADLTNNRVRILTKSK